jgi:hypothetical protein
MNKEKRRYDTRSISITGTKRKKLLYIFIISLTVFVLAIVYFLIPNILGDKKSVSPKIRQKRQLAAQVGKLETVLKKKEVEFSNLLKKYYNRTGENLPDLSGLGLSEEHKKVLEDKIKNQGDVSIKELLSDILEKTNEISGIKETIKKYEALLPRPHIVKEGENHYQIAMDFLVNKKGIKKKKANYLVERTLLFESLIKDFKVWNFYSGNEYGTFVTQGDATISPNELRRKAKKKLTDEKDNAIAAKDKLEEELKILETKRDILISQTKNLNSKINKLNSKINELKDGEQDLKNRIEVLSQKEAEMQRKLNSLFYIVDSKDNLIQKEFIKGGFLRRTKLNETSPEYFKDCIDLRKKKAIEISAKEFQLSEIDEITLYPKFYKRDIDYEVKIEENKQKAVLTILIDEKFKSDRVVISVK